MTIPELTACVEAAKVALDAVKVAHPAPDAFSVPLEVAS